LRKLTTFLQTGNLVISDESQRIQFLLESKHYGNQGYLDIKADKPFSRKFYVTSEQIEISDLVLFKVNKRGNYKAQVKDGDYFLDLNNFPLEELLQKKFITVRILELTKKIITLQDNPFGLSNIGGVYYECKCEPVVV